MGVDYAEHQRTGGKYGKEKARDFIKQYEDTLVEKKMTNLQASNLKPLIQQIRQVFRRKMPKTF